MMSANEMMEVEHDIDNQNCVETRTGTINPSTSMKSRDKENVVVGLQGVGGFAFEFPVGVVDEDQDSWATACRVVSSVPTLPSGVCLNWDTTAGYDRKW